jgi:hypothetical protein
MTRRSTLLAFATAIATALVLPAPALAHGIGGRSDLPIPRWLFAWAAAMVLIVSFVALATLWPKPRLERARSRIVCRFPSVLGPVCGAVGLALFAVVVYAGFAGEQELPGANLAPTFIYVLFWVGLAFLSGLFGDVFRAFNPWRAVARAVSWTVRNVAPDSRLLQPSAYPRWLGRWPAVVGILGFAWLELVYVDKDTPSTLAWLSVGYAVVQFAGMGRYGIEAWTSRGDAFAVYFNLFSRLSPLRWYRDRLELRPPLAGVTRLEPLPGTIALLAAMIGSTSFDGLEQGSLWINSIAPELQTFFFSNFGLEEKARVFGQGPGEKAAVELSGTVGLLAMVMIVGAIYRLGIWGMHSVDRRTPTGGLAKRFVHTLVPIALAYVVAHYFSLLVYEGQATAFLASDPLGDGSNIFGTADSQVDFGVLTPNSIWYVQVGALIVGHVAALALAHDRALVLYRRPREAIRSQYWMLVVMVAFTTLGLWLLSSAR